MRKSVVALIDVVSIGVFSVFGRGAHSEGLGPAQVWSTAWPFLIGLGTGWMVLLGLRRNPAAVPSGAILWATTLAVGMTIWGIRGERIPHWSFVLVAGTVTAIFLMGWRKVVKFSPDERRL